MFEMPHPGYHHHQSILHTVIDRILIPDRPAGLDECRYTRRMRHRYAVIEWEEGIARQYRSF